MNPPNPNIPSSQHGPAGAQPSFGQLPGFTNRDLIELAQMDALGLLDESERQGFEKAFRAAPASIQQLVRDSQLRATDIEPWLPAVSPAASLRERVLAAVSAAVRSEQGQPSVAGRVTPVITRAKSVTHYWRAAAIGSMAAVIMMGVVTLKLYGDFQRMNEVVSSNAMADMFLKEFGPRFENALYSDKTEFVQFSPAAASMGGAAVMLVDAGAATGQFFAKDLPQIEGGYTLALVDPAGNVVRTIARIDSPSSRVVNQFANLRLNPGESFVIKSTAQNETVMQSRNL